MPCFIVWQYKRSSGIVWPSEIDRLAKHGRRCAPGLRASSVGDPRLSRRCYLEFYRTGTCAVVGLSNARLAFHDERRRSVGSTPTLQTPPAFPSENVIWNVSCKMTAASSLLRGNDDKKVHLELGTTGDLLDYGREQHGVDEVDGGVR